MKITSVNIPADENIGLSTIEMKRLGNLVILAGKNGSGKSRILRKIFDEKFKTILTKDSVANYRRSKKDHEDVVKIENATLDGLKASLQFNNNFGLAQDIKDKEHYVQSLSGTIKEIDDLLESDVIMVDEFVSKPSYLKFTPTSTDLRDSSNITPESLRASIEELKKHNFSSLSHTTLPTIQYIQNFYLNLKNSEDEEVKEDTIKDALSELNRLKTSIKKLLGFDLGRDSDGIITFNRKKYADIILSEGQRILLQYCVALHFTGQSIKDSILVIDEPENHLHPSVIIEIIDAIIAAVPSGQVWIATHSIPLLANYDPSSIFYVEDGKVEYAGSIPQKVLESLLGGAEGIAKLEDFVSLPAKLATHRYACECLYEPNVVMTSAGDKQSNQIKRCLTSLAQGKAITLLDIGCGKGRTIANLSELEGDKRSELISKLDYVGFDLSTENAAICKGIIEEIYGSSETRYFNTNHQLARIYSSGAFDVVLLCNVLHEIDPSEWISFFSETGTIGKYLKEDGYILFIEDNQIPTGEKAYKKGFLVLDTEGFKALFDIKVGDQDFLVDHYDNSGRLNAHMISKKYLNRVNTKTKVEALKHIRHRAAEEILSLRDKDGTYSNGKMHGFWTQQLANAQLNLREYLTESFSH